MQTTIERPARARAAPKKDGWYSAWTRASGGERNRGVYRCVGGLDGVACAPPGEKSFLPTTHAYFDDAIWRGPFASVEAASVVNRFHCV